MTTKTITTDQSLLDITECKRFGLDCSPTHDWITINATRNDHNLIFIPYALSEINSQNSRNLGDMTFRGTKIPVFSGNQKY